MSRSHNFTFYSSSFDGDLWSDRACSFEVPLSREHTSANRGQTGLSLASIAIPKSCLLNRTIHYQEKQAIEIRVGYNISLDLIGFMKHVLDFPKKLLPNIDVDFGRLSPSLRAILRRFTLLLQNDWDEENLPEDNEAPIWDSAWDGLYRKTLVTYLELVDPITVESEKQALKAFFARACMLEGNARRLMDSQRSKALLAEERREREMWERDQEENLYYEARVGDVADNTARKKKIKDLKESDQAASKEAKLAVVRNEIAEMEELKKKTNKELRQLQKDTMAEIKRETKVTAELADGDLEEAKRKELEEQLAQIVLDKDRLLEQVAEGAHRVERIQTLSDKLEKRLQALTAAETGGAGQKRQAAGTDATEQPSPKAKKSKSVLDRYGFSRDNPGYLDSSSSDEEGGAEPEAVMSSDEDTSPARAPLGEFVFSNVCCVTLPFLNPRTIGWQGVSERVLRRQLYSRYVKMLNDLKRKSLVQDCMGFDYSHCSESDLWLDIHFELDLSTFFECHLIAPMSFFECLNFHHYSWFFSNPSLSLTIDRPRHRTWVDLKSMSMSDMVPGKSYVNYVYLECDQIERNRMLGKPRPILMGIPVPILEDDKSDYFFFTPPRADIVPLRVGSVKKLTFSLRDFRGALLTGTSVLYGGKDIEAPTLISFRLHTPS